MFEELKSSVSRYRGDAVFKKEKTIGVVYSWPGSMQSGEVEFIERLKAAAANVGYQIVVISKEGHILDDL